MSLGWKRIYLLIVPCVVGIVFQIALWEEVQMLMILIQQCFLEAMDHPGRDTTPVCSDRVPDELFDLVIGIE
jgi:hypothetical protein